MTSDVDADSVRRHNEQFAHKEPSVPTESAAVLPTLESFPEAVRRAMPNCSMVCLRDEGAQSAAFPVRDIFHAIVHLPRHLTCVKRFVSSAAVLTTLYAFLRCGERCLTALWFAFRMRQCSFPLSPSVSSLTPQCIPLGTLLASKDS